MRTHILVGYLMIAVCTINPGLAAEQKELPDFRIVVSSIERKMKWSSSVQRVALGQNSRSGVVRRPSAPPRSMPAEPRTSTNGTARNRV